MKMTMMFEITTYRGVLTTQAARDSWKHITQERIRECLLRELGFGSKPIRTEIIFEKGEPP